MSDPLPFFREVAARHPRCAWLDGGGAREWSGRRSLVAWLEPDDVSLTYDARTRTVRRHREGRRTEVVPGGIFEALESEMAAGDPGDHWFGYLGYACRPDLPARVSSGGVPDAVWMRASHVRFFDHDPVDPTHSAVAAASGPVPAAYRRAFARVQEELHAGNTYEVNLTRRDALASTLPPLAAYERLRATNPAPYAGFLQHDRPGARGWLLSSSPERYALVTADRVLETRPIKGTTPRGSTPIEDAARRDELATGRKYRAENLMIVDLLRHDLALVCAPGTVEVPDLMSVESYASVHQLVSTVRGRLRDDVTTVGALRALFPAGSMTGAPKLRTMQVIADVESSARGAYAGAFGWIGGDGRADLGVVIRTLTTTGDGRYAYGTGGGITVLSDVAEEYAEAGLKAARLRGAVLPPASSP